MKEVLRRDGKIVLVSIKNWKTRTWFSLDKFHKLVAELQHADLEHKTKWLLIIPKLRASQKVRLLLAANKIEVVETGQQILLEKEQTQSAQSQWLQTLNEDLRPKLYDIFGLLLYRVYNYSIHRSIRIINTISYLQSIKEFPIESFGETIFNHQNHQKMYPVSASPEWQFSMKSTASENLNVNLWKKRSICEIRIGKLPAYSATLSVDSCS